MVPAKRDYAHGYELAYQITSEKLAAIADLAQQCERCGARYRESGPGKIIELEYLEQTYRITLPGPVFQTVAGEEVRLRDKVLVLHYFVQAKGTPLTARPISYKEIPGTVNYFETFSKRAITPLVQAFGADPKRLYEAADLLKGVRAEYGDASVTIRGFSRVPVTLVLWGGDDEFPASGNILFDSSITDYLTIEDVNILCENIAWTLVKGQRQR